MAASKNLTQKTLTGETLVATPPITKEKEGRSWMNLLSPYFDWKSTSIRNKRTWFTMKCKDCKFPSPLTVTDKGEGGFAAHLKKVST